MDRSMAVMSDHRSTAKRFPLASAEAQPRRDLSYPGFDAGIELHAIFIQFAVIIEIILFPYIFQIYYPSNFLRNVALNNTRTDYVFLSDADFIPMFGLHSHVKLAIDQGLLDNPKKKRVSMIRYAHKQDDLKGIWLLWGWREEQRIF